MVTKVLRRKEVELGFVQIPVKNRTELFGYMLVPFGAMGEKLIE